MGPFKPVLQPYESIFLGRNHIQPKDVSRVDEIFRREGLALSPEFKDLSDHISVDFEFMSYLCSKEIEADESQDATTFFAYQIRQQSFLENHIINWVPAFGLLLIATGTMLRLFSWLKECGIKGPEWEEACERME